MRPFRNKIYRGIVDAAEAAGFEPFGNDDSWTLLFRSPRAVLTVNWDRPFFRAECEPRTPIPGVALDDDLFRQAIDHEAPDPNGGHREWLDHDAFVSFLRSRLSDFERAALSDDPGLRARLAELRAVRAQRQQHQWDNMKGPPKDRTQPRDG